MFSSVLVAIPCSALLIRLCCIQTTTASPPSAIIPSGIPMPRPTFSPVLKPEEDGGEVDDGTEIPFDVFEAA